MRQVVDRITCDRCGQVYEFEALRVNVTPIVARLEKLTPHLLSLGWSCVIVPDSRYASNDRCPSCVRAVLEGLPAVL